MSQPWNPPPPPISAVTAPGTISLLAIIATVPDPLVFCVYPHGLVSLIFALKVDKKAHAGDLQGAITAAKQAKIGRSFRSVSPAISLVIG